MDDQLFNENNRIKPKWIKWGKVGNWFKGTFLSVRLLPSTMPDKLGQMVPIYEFRMKAGEYNDLDQNKQPIEPSITIEAGEIFNVGGGKKAIDDAMRNVAPGTIIGMHFADIKASKTKGYNPSKTIKVYKGEMDPEYQGETAEDMAESTFPGAEAV